MSDACIAQTQSTGNLRASEAKVLEMKSVPDGHFLVNLQTDGKDRLVNIEVKDNAASA